MSDKIIRLVLTALAVALPGPWTPVIVLAYVLSWFTRQRDTPTADGPAVPRSWPSPDPYACVPMTAASRTTSGAIVRSEAMTTKNNIVAARGASIEPVDPPHTAHLAADAAIGDSVHDRHHATRGTL